MRVPCPYKAELAEHSLQGGCVAATAAPWGKYMVSDPRGNCGKELTTHKLPGVRLRPTAIFIITLFKKNIIELRADQK